MRAYSAYSFQKVYILNIGALFTGFFNTPVIVAEVYGGFVYRLALKNKHEIFRFF